MTTNLVYQIRDSLNLEGQVPVFIYLRNRMARLHPQALGSLFFASYDSQGYGGGTRPRHHTEWSSLKCSGFTPQTGLAVGTTCLYNFSNFFYDFGAHALGFVDEGCGINLYLSALTTQHPSIRKSRHYFADSGGRSVGIVRLRTKTTEFLFFFILVPRICLLYHNFYWKYNRATLFLEDMNTGMGESRI
jgi:hypothetical protein